MSKTKTLITLVVLIACVQGCKKKAKSSSKAKPTKSLTLETNNFYTTKVFGNNGPTLYVVSWVHDGGTRMRMSKDQLRILLKSRRSRNVVMAVEGEASGKRINYVDQWSRKTREILQFAEQEGVHIYGAENMKLNETVRAAMGFIMRKGRTMSVEKICTFFYGIQMISKKRTAVLLHTLKKFKETGPDNLVIGMMGDDHFTLSEHPILANFAQKYNVRIVLYYTKRASKLHYPASWPLAKCGDMKRFKNKYAKNIDRMSKGG
ncbi:hypothetical protein ACFL3T_01655 [Patescibacteria group bacterium]